MKTLHDGTSRATTLRRVGLALPVVLVAVCSTLFLVLSPEPQAERLAAYGVALSTLR